MQKIKRLNNSICPVCGRPYNININTVCTSCKKSPPAFQALRSWGLHQGPLRDAIHALKYQRDIGLGEVLGQHLVELFKQQNWQVDLVAPVPLGMDRLEERGYNQSHYLARPIALSCRLSYKPTAVKRTRNTVSQVGLNAVERTQNVQDAFWGDPNHLAGKSILLIDDVTTTGATIQSCAQACLLAGAVSVYGLTVARAPLAHPTGQQSTWI